MAIRKSNKANANEFTYTVIERCGVISENSRGWKTELRLISWNEKDAKYDIRPWHMTENGEQMGKGITLTGEELEQLAFILDELRKYDTETDASETEPSGEMPFEQ